MRLEAADLDLLCAAGVIEVLSRAAAEEQRRIAEEPVRSKRQEGGRLLRAIRRNELRHKRRGAAEEPGLGRSYFIPGYRVSRLKVSP